jgi:hypothetical protein
MATYRVAANMELVRSADKGFEECAKTGKLIAHRAATDKAGKAG